MMRRFLAALCVVAGTVLPAAAGPQVEQPAEAPPPAAPARPRNWSVNVGAAVALFEPAHDDRSRSVRIQPLLRIGGRRRGLAPAIELNWFGTDVKQAIGGRRTTAGRLRVRPIMAGVGYRTAAGPFTTCLSLVGGYAFNAFTPDEQARAAYRDSLGVDLVSYEVDNGPAASAAASLTYDVGPRVALVGSIGLLVTRPRVTIVNGGNRQTATWNADSIVVKVGVTFRVL